MTTTIPLFIAHSHWLTCFDRPVGVISTLMVIMGHRTTTPQYYKLIDLFYRIIKTSPQDPQNKNVYKDRLEQQVAQ